MTAQGIMWFGIGAVVGWPFSAALIAPFVVEELMIASLTRQGIEVAQRFLDGTVRTLIVLVMMPYLSTHSTYLLNWSRRSKWPLIPSSTTRL